MSAFKRCALAVGLAAAAPGLCAPGAPARPPLQFAEGPFSFDTAPGRLPKNVVPQSYDIAITPDVSALRFQGTESVSLRFRSATDTIVFNSLNETLENVRLDGQPVKSTVSDDAQQLTTVKLSEPATVGPHTLTFTYRGKIETGPQGLFAQHFTYPSGAGGVMLSTQMEATDARRMFPCWDEPAFRARFQLTATVPAAWATIGNMPIAHRELHGTLATVTFERSPSMPSYLVEFSAGDLASISGRSGATALGVWAVRGEQQEGRTALANAARILADYNRYFDYPYPLPKLDSIAIPGGFSGAMENWGAITYTDELLLVRPSSTSASRQEVFAVQAHEMAHQWNGDLVTMAWWDDIWLNESFASWMAAKETALRHPEWHWWENQDASKESAMAADAQLSSHAIQQHVTDELQAANAFDSAITYDKGQAFLRMLEAYLGPDVFRAGIRAYIKAHAFSNATTADLWNGLHEASGKDIDTIASGWTTQPGFPLVSVRAVCDPAGNRTITLSQRRFLLHGTDPRASDWSIPLQVRVGLDAVPKSVLLTQARGQRIPAGRCGEPLSANADAIGFYRTDYDPVTFRTNAEHFREMPDGDRIALLDDQWALARSGAARLSSYFALASSMGSDLDTRAWQQIASALNHIEYDARGTPTHAAFAAYARSILKPAFERVGWVAGADETPDRLQLRRTLVSSLGAWGDQAVVAEARRRFEAFVKDPSSVAADDQEAILSIVARSADEATFAELLALAKRTRSVPEMERLYAALMDVRDPALAAKAAQIAVSPQLPSDADDKRISWIAALASEHPTLAWRTFTANAAMLVKPAGMNAPLELVEAPRIFWNGVPLDRVEAWVRARVPAEMAPFIARSMASARQQLAEKVSLVREAKEFLAPSRRATEAQ
ncbi:MAG TPA: M1 family metallopeptidase [Steroidobacteraceae bacterium]|nr:M1 family metallopeptidase [Steroidobacteraceae bacterium]